MKCRVDFISLFLFCFIKHVNLVSLDGPSLTRYDPCGLGVVHFDLVGETHWKGVINFGLYSMLHEVHIQIYFVKPVVVYTSKDYNNFETKRKTLYDFSVRHVAPIQASYNFYLSVRDNEDDVPTVSKFVMNNVTLCSQNYMDLPNFKADTTTPQMLPNKTLSHVCGRRFLNHTELNSMRTEAEAGEWPWHVAMLIRSHLTGRAKYDCGGNIISMTAVLTAGHCIFKRGRLLDPSSVIVIAGINNYKDPYQRGRQEFTAKRLILHPAYNDDYTTSDLGIIVVDRFFYTEFVQPICIWGPAYDKTNLFGMEATIVGFGYKEDGNQSDVLRSSTTLVQPDSTCINFNARIYKSLLNEFTFCAGYGPTTAINPLNGDSGGGLVVRTIQPDHRISWFLRGVLSKCVIPGGRTVCDPTNYVLYTDVGPHYGWIVHNSGLQFKINVND